MPARVQHAALHQAVRAAEDGGAIEDAQHRQPDARLPGSVLWRGDPDGQPGGQEVPAHVREGAQPATGGQLSALLQTPRPQAALPQRHAGEGRAQQGQQAQVLAQEK